MATYVFAQYINHYFDDFLFQYKIPLTHVYVFIHTEVNVMVCDL